jgi:hypothetical protein
MALHGAISHKILIFNLSYNNYEYFDNQKFWEELIRVIFLRKSFIWSTWT